MQDSQPYLTVCMCLCVCVCMCVCVHVVFLQACLSVCVFAFCMLECVYVSCWGSVILAVGVCLSRSALLHSQQQTLPPSTPAPSRLITSPPLFPSLSPPFHLSFHLAPFIALSIHPLFHFSLLSISAVISVTST